MSSDPVPDSVRWNPFAIARKASSTTTTSAIETTVDSESQNRRGMLLMLIMVTAATCSNTERISASPQRGGDAQPEGIERRQQARHDAKPDHQRHRGEGDAGRERHPGNEIRQAVAHPPDHEQSHEKAGYAAQEGKQYAIRRAPGAARAPR